MNRPAILIVDDEPDFLFSMSQALDAEFDVITALGGLNALSLFEKFSHSISIILIDLQMPELNGIDLITIIRNKDVGIPIVVVTGNSTHLNAKKCANLNVQAYLDKPVDINYLINKVNKLTGREDCKLLQSLWMNAYATKMSTMNPSIKRALSYIRQNYKNDFGREEVAEYLNVSPDHFSRLFYKECGLHFKDYLNRYRIYISKEHLNNSNKKIIEIAKSVGVSNPVNFCRLFRKFTGVSAKEFRM